MTQVTTRGFQELDGSPGRSSLEPLDLSVLVPAHNEEGTVGLCLRRVESVLSLHDFRFEIIVVDDGSTDDTLASARSACNGGNSICVIRTPSKVGKGAALMMGLKKARGGIVVVLDADLEYAPEEMPRVIRPIIDGSSDVVFGSRFVGQTDGMSLSHRLGNMVLTGTTNLLYQGRLTDVMTGYKAFRRSVLERIDVGQNGFGFEVEVAAKALRRGFRVSEVPITYQRRRFGRSKIRWTDGIRCLLNLIELGRRKSS